MTTHHYKKGFITAVLGAFFATLMVTFVKLSKEAPNETLVFFRNVISLILILPFLFHKKFTMKTKRIGMHVCRAITGIIGIYSYFYAARNLPLTNAVLLENTFPLFIPLIVLFWEKLKISKKCIIALVIGFIGIILILKPTEEFTGFASAVGLFGGICAAFVFISVRQLAKTENTRSILFYYFIACIVISFFPMVYAWKEVRPIIWFYILLIGLCAVGYQYYITRASAYIPASKVGCLMYSAVVFGTFFDWLIWNKFPDVWTVIGCALVIFGGIISLLDRSMAISISKKKKN